MNSFLLAAKKNHEISNKINLDYANEPTHILEKKLVIANEFSGRVRVELIDYVERLKDKEKMKDLISLVEEVSKKYHSIFGSLYSVMEAIPPFILLEEDMKKFLLDDRRQGYNFYSLMTNNTSYRVNNELYYKNNIQLILAKAFYFLNLINARSITFSSLITNHIVVEDNDYKNLFLYYKHFTTIAKRYLDGEFELTMDDQDEVLEKKVKEFKRLNNVNKSMTLDDLALVYKKLNELEVDFDLVFKLINQYSYVKKSGNHDLFNEVIDFNVQVIDGYDGLYDDYLMTYELISNGLNLEEINSERYNELRKMFIDKNVYNHMYKDKFVYYLTNDEEVQLNVSEQMSQLNKIVSVLKEKELNEKNADVKSKIADIILKLSSLTPKKSKVFLRLLSEKIDESFVNYDSILFDSVIFDSVQVNMFNEKTMDLYLVTKNFMTSKMLELMKFETKLAPEFLYEIIQSEFKYKLSNLLVEKGIKNDIIIRILKSFTKVLEGNNIIKEEDYLKLINEMETKEINELYKATTPKKEISKENVFSLYLLEKMHKIFKEVENDNQLRFILRNDDNIQDSLNEMLEKELESKKEYKVFQNKLNATEIFFEKHKSSLLNFLYDDKHSLALTYAKGMPDQQANNVFLLAKADIAGMLHEVKFSKIEQELEMALENEKKDLWKKELSLDFNRFNVKEVVDFRTLMELGENPTRSCMNYVSGQYRRCLLSIFDSTKQYVGVYDNGKLVARAILRLTKTTKGTTNSVLGFEDVENLTTNTTTFEDKNKNEEPVLFLERMYTNYNSNQRIDMQNYIVKLVKEKAELMGIKAIAASNYINNTTCKEGSDTMKVFITHSQNGNQYLDSFGGQATENSGGVYKTTSNYGIIHEV